MQAIPESQIPLEAKLAPPPDAPRRLIGIVFAQLLLPALGAVAGWCFLVWIFLPRFGYGDMDRLVQIGEHLKEVKASEPYLCGLGSSILQDGMDAQIVRSELGKPCRVENLADPGAKLWDHLSKLPLVLEANPEVVMFGIGPSDDYDHTMANDKRYAMSVVGYVDAWSPEYSENLPRELSERQNAVHQEAAWRKWLHFRVIPMLWINGNFRYLLRRNDIRKVSNNWTTPHVYQRPVSAAQLEVHLGQIRDAWSQGINDPTDNHATFDQLAKYSQSAGAKPVFLLYPIHPDLWDVAEPLLERLKADASAAATEHGGLVIDSTHLLSADDFFDALHPSAEGRQKWSRQIGKTLTEHVTLRTKSVSHGP